MKAISFCILALVLCVNILFAKPALADRPPITSNPDYIEITQTLNSLNALKNNPAEGQTAEEIQQQISNLEFQKYTLETGVNWGQCTNQTGQTIAIYGTKEKKSSTTYDNALYFLADGQTTEDEWNCNGVYLPNDVQVAGIATEGQAVALKIFAGTQLVLTKNVETGEIELNVPPARILKAGDANWFIPEISQATINNRVANAPTNENS